MKLPEGHRLVHFERIDSTNAEARRLAEQGETGPVWVLADEQTSGRGRLGRNWVSEPGNLYVTLLFSATAPLQLAAQISFVAAVAVHEVVSRLLPNADFSLKWPNDILMNGAKCCGLLAEVVRQNPTCIALGCGLNLAHAPAGTSYPVTALGPQFTPLGILEPLSHSLAHWLATWQAGEGFAGVRAQWLRHASGLGEKMTANGTEGWFEGLGADGSLLLRGLDGTQTAIHAGEVRFAAMEKS